MDDKRKLLLQEFPALEPVIDRVRSMNGVIESADLTNEDRCGLMLRISFSFDGHGITYQLHDLKDMESFFKVCEATSLQKIPGKYIRIECFSQASWCPFFKVYHIIDDEKSFILKYEPEELERYARGKMV